MKFDLTVHIKIEQQPKHFCVLHICYGWLCSGCWLSGSTKSLPEPMLTNHQWDRVAFTWGQFTGNAKNIHIWNEFENYWSKIKDVSHWGQWLKALITANFLTALRRLAVDYKFSTAGWQKLYSHLSLSVCLLATLRTNPWMDFIQFSR